jgi:hypothetical protein
MEKKEKPKPIFNVRPFFVDWLYGKPTPQEQTALTPPPEASKPVEAPQPTEPEPKPLVKTYPVLSPQDRTAGIERLTQP